jgi:hypothetical protein
VRGNGHNVDATRSIHKGHKGEERMPKFCGRHRTLPLNVDLHEGIISKRC